MHAVNKLSVLVAHQTNIHEMNPRSHNSHIYQTVQVDCAMDFSSCCSVLQRYANNFDKFTFFRPESMRSHRSHRQQGALGSGFSFSHWRRGGTEQIGHLMCHKSFCCWLRQQANATPKAWKFVANPKQGVSRIKTQ